MTAAEAEAMATAIERDPLVASAEPNYVIHVDATPDATTDQITETGLWGLDRIDQRGAVGATRSYSYRNTGAGVDVYVVDTGIRADHNEFATQTGTRVKVGANFSTGTSTEDLHGHGTHVAAIIAGTNVGVAKAASLIPVRVLDAKGDGTAASVINGLNWIVTDHTSAPAVANLSLGGTANDAIDLAVSAVIADGVTVIAAAGNGDSAGVPLDSCTQSPGRVAAAITVNASTSSDSAASFSNYGACSDIYAPGVGILSAAFDKLDPSQTNLYRTDSGTSMAAPFVAGVAARLLSGRGATSPAQVWEIIKADATTLAFAPANPDPDLLLFSGVGAFSATSISPAEGTTSGGTSVTVTGVGLTTNTKVSFGTTEATTTYVSSTQVTATSPVGSAGSVAVTVKSTGVEIVESTLSAAFKYVAPAVTPPPDPAPALARPRPRLRPQHQRLRAELRLPPLVLLARIATRPRRRSHNRPSRREMCRWFTSPREPLLPTHSQRVPQPPPETAQSCSSRKPRFQPRLQQNSTG